MEPEHQRQKNTRRLVGAAVVDGDADGERHLLGDAGLLELLHVKATSKADLGVVLIRQAKREREKESHDMTSHRGSNRESS